LICRTAHAAAAKLRRGLGGLLAMSGAWSGIGLHLPVCHCTHTATASAAVEVLRHVTQLARVVLKACTCVQAVQGQGAAGEQALELLATHLERTEQRLGQCVEVEGTDPCDHDKTPGGETAHMRALSALERAGMPHVRADESSLECSVLIATTCGNGRKCMRLMTSAEAAREHALGDVAMPVPGHRATVGTANCAVGAAAAVPTNAHSCGVSQSAGGVMLGQNQGTSGCGEGVSAPGSGAGGSSVGTAERYVHCVGESAAKWLTERGHGTIRVRKNGTMLQIGEGIKARFARAETGRGADVSGHVAAGREGQHWTWEVLWGGDSEDADAMLAFCNIAVASAASGRAMMALNGD
jgi:hypothetical protein